MRIAARGLVSSLALAGAGFAQMRFADAYIQPSAPNTIPEMRVRLARALRVAQRHDGRPDPHRVGRQGRERSGRSRVARLSWQGEPVVDGTGLDGRYDITINFTPAALLAPLPQPGDRGDTVPEPTGAIPLDEALRKQLGLRLEARRVLTPVLVIDQVNEAPTEN